MWVAPPYYGALWTPPYWGFYGGRYGFYHGYWGRYIGFYGGVNYGYGYTGRGYQGGYWHGNDFYYNRTVNNISNVHITNVYNRTIVNNITVNNYNRASYNGGPNGVQLRPIPAEVAAYRAPHAPPMSGQLQLQREAAANRAQFASVNHGRPETFVAPRASRGRPRNAPAPVMRPVSYNRPHRQTPWRQGLRTRWSRRPAMRWSPGRTRRNTDLKTPRSQDPKPGLRHRDRKSSPGRQSRNQNRRPAPEHAAEHGRSGAAPRTADRRQDQLQSRGLLRNSVLLQPQEPQKLILSLIQGRPSRTAIVAQGFSKQARPSSRAFVFLGRNQETIRTSRKRGPMYPLNAGHLDIGGRRGAGDERGRQASRLPRAGQTPRRRSRRSAPAKTTQK